MFHIVRTALGVIAVTEFSLLAVVNAVIIVIIPNSPPSICSRNRTHIRNVVVCILSV